MYADFNNDGKLDIGFASGEGNQAFVTMLGNGDGTFQSPIQQSPKYAPSIIALADLNGDGFVDVAEGQLRQPFAWFGQGDGSFLLGPKLSGVQAIALTDLNNDGRPDVIVNTGSTFETLIQVGIPQPLSPKSFTFGSQKVGTVSHGKAFTFYNAGSAPVTVASINVPAGFKQTNSCTVVNTRSTCTITVQFAPTAVGTDLGTVTVTFKPSLAGPFPNLTAAIRGQGI
jgi:hypothetical protein